MTRATFETREIEPRVVETRAPTTQDATGKAGPCSLSAGAGGTCCPTAQLAPTSPCPRPDSRRSPGHRT